MSASVLNVNVCECMNECLWVYAYNFTYVIFVFQANFIIWLPYVTWLCNTAGEIMDLFSKFLPQWSSRHDTHPCVHAFPPLHPALGPLWMQVWHGPKWLRHHQRQFTMENVLRVSSSFCQLLLSCFYLGRQHMNSLEVQKIIAWNHLLFLLHSFNILLWQGLTLPLPSPLAFSGHSTS